MDRRLVIAGVALVVLILARSPRTASVSVPAGVDPRTLPMGMYAGNPVLPQQVRVTLVDQLHDSLTGPPGILESQSTNRAGRYWGTDAVPGPVFPAAPSKKVNRVVDVEMAPVQALQARGIR